MLAFSQETAAILKPLLFIIVTLWVIKGAIPPGGGGGWGDGGATA